MSDRWERTIPTLISQWKSEGRAQRWMTDPWARTVRSMVQSWRIRQSRTTKPRQIITNKITDWNDAVGQMIHAANQLNRKQLEKGTWKRWCRARTRRPFRYVPIAHRSSV